MSDPKGDSNSPLSADGGESTEGVGFSHSVGTTGLAGMLLAGAVAFGAQAQAAEARSSEPSPQDKTLKASAADVRSLLLQLAQGGPYPPPGSPWDNWQNFDNWQNY